MRSWQSSINLLISEQDADGNWLNVYDKYLENMSIDQIRKMYESIPRPITIMQRAIWYKRTSFALFGDLPVVELLSYIIYLVSENQVKAKKKDNDTKTNFGLKNSLDIFGQVFSFFSSSSEGSELDTELNEFVELLSKQTSSPSYSDLGSFIRENPDLVKGKLEQVGLMIVGLKKVFTILESQDPALFEKVQDATDANKVFLNLDDAYMNIIFDYFTLMRKEDKEDIILDYLQRFNTFVERHYKEFVKFLCGEAESTKTLGQLHRILKVKGTFLQTLTNIRNAVSHGTFSINIDAKDILKSKVEFINIIPILNSTKTKKGKKSNILGRTC